MGNLRWLLLSGLSALVTVLALAQHPTLDHAAANIVTEYQSDTCEQLWRHRVKQAPQEQRVIGSLRSDPGHARGVHQQDRRPRREQDARLRHDPMRQSAGTESPDT